MVARVMSLAEQNLPKVVCVGIGVTVAWTINAIAHQFFNLKLWQVKSFLVNWLSPVPALYLVCKLNAYFPRLISADNWSCWSIFPISYTVMWLTDFSTNFIALFGVGIFLGFPIGWHLAEDR